LDAVSDGVSAPAGNRRRSPRYPFRAKGTVWVLSDVAADPFPVETTDVSAGGMMLHGSAPVLGDLAIGTTLLIGLRLEGRDEPLSVRGRLVWRRRGLMSLLGSWSFGVEFLHARDEDIRALLDLARRAESSA
jgi:hypothetical protein